MGRNTKTKPDIGQLARLVAADVIEQACEDGIAHSYPMEGIVTDSEVDRLNQSLLGIVEELRGT